MSAPCGAVCEVAARRRLQLHLERHAVVVAGVKLEAWTDGLASSAMATHGSSGAVGNPLPNELLRKRTETDYSFHQVSKPGISNPRNDKLRLVVWSDSTGPAREQRYEGRGLISR